MPGESVSFEQQMTSYREAVDNELARHSRGFIVETKQNFGEHAAIAVEAFCSVLSRGGKRIRGSLVICGYEMCGGQDTEMIVNAAAAIELIHAYILAVDDIQDRSELRHGGPSVHKLLESSSQNQNWRGDHFHTGVSLALNAALAGNHYAQIVLGGLNVDPEVRLKVLTMMNRTMITTAHGQSGDIINEVNGDVTQEDVAAVITWKTAYYTILNPLQIGMVLAGADEDTVKKVEPYGLVLGRAFQFTDDILTYSEEFTDKDQAVDIRDGKVTLIILDALKNGSQQSGREIQSYLGKQDLSQPEFIRCVELVKQTGAVGRALDSARQLCDQATKETEHFPTDWDRVNVGFLRGLPEYIMNRHT